MTHGTLEIYVYDTQHLKHNGFTETSSLLGEFLTAFDDLVHFLK